MPTTSVAPPRLNSFKTIGLISQFELVRLFMTKRGMVLVAAFAIVWLLILKYPIYEAASYISNPALLENLMFFSQKLNLEYLLTWQYPELAVYWVIAAFIFPATSVLFASDQTASDHNRGTLRFISLRASRFHILLGRFFGQLLIIATLIMMTVTATWCMAMWRDASSIGAGGSELVLVAVNLLVLCLPFIALMSLFNIIFNSSRLSVAATIIVIPIVSMVISFAAYGLPAIESLLMILPGHQLSGTVQNDGITSAPMIILPLVQTVVYLAIAQVILTRRSL